jgi:hypothetical protein
MTKQKEFKARTIVVRFHLDPLEVEALAFAGIRTYDQLYAELLTSGMSQFDDRINDMDHADDEPEDVD